MVGFLSTPFILTGQAFDPVSLFTGGEIGALYEPGPGTCYTDTGGTTLAVEGNAVARINDRSGNTAHLTQSTSGLRPTLEKTVGGLWYLDFDGIDDEMTGALAATVSSAAIIIALETASANNRTTFIWENELASNDSRINIHPSFFASSLQRRFFDTFNTTTGRLLETTTFTGAGVFVGNATAGAREFRQNGVVGMSGGAPVAPAAAFSRVRILEDGDALKFFGGMVIDRSLSASEVDDCEAYFAERAGVAL